MSIKARDRKLLWGRAGNRCAFVACHRELVVVVEITSRVTAVGEECHIRARGDGGPRADPTLTIEERDAYENLILFCHDHHKIIDDDPVAWTVDTLLSLKASHEEWVRNTLEPIPDTTDAIDLQYAAIVDGWAERVDLDQWQAWTSHLVTTRPSIETSLFDDFKGAAEWLFRRVWPGAYDDLEARFNNFVRVSEDLAGVLSRSLVPWGEDREVLRIDVFYKHDWHEQAFYDDLAAQFEWVVDLIQDLVFELTRAGNWLLDGIRTYIDPLYRLDEGVLTIVREQGIFEFLLWKPRYEGTDTATQEPYPGLAEFTQQRTQRDVHFGDGMNEKAFRRITPLRIGE